MRLTSIDGSNTTHESLYIRTEPEMTAEVLAELRKSLSEDSDISFDEWAGRLVVHGITYPTLEDFWFVDLQDRVAEAYEVVMAAEYRKQQSHNALLDRLVQLSGLPVT